MSGETKPLSERLADKWKPSKSTKQLPPVGSAARKAMELRGETKE